MAELNADEALLTSSTEHLCLHASVSWTPLYADVLHIHASLLSPFLVFSFLNPFEHYFLLPY